MDGLFTVASHGHATAPLDVLAGLALLSFIPFLLMMCTSYVRIIVVLSLVRSAIGTTALPPNAVLSGLALVLTVVVMTPTIQRVQAQAIDPYARGAISQSQALDRASAPLRTFMLHQTRKTDIDLFERVAHRRVQAPSSAPLSVLVPAFVVGELRSAFAIGFAIYLPFVAIDLAVAAILMGL